MNLSVGDLEWIRNLVEVLVLVILVLVLLNSRLLPLDFDQPLSRSYYFLARAPPASTARSVSNARQHRFLTGGGHRVSPDAARYSAGKTVDSFFRVTVEEDRLRTR